MALYMGQYLMSSQFEVKPELNHCTVTSQHLLTSAVKWKCLKQWQCIKSVYDKCALPEEDGL